MSMQLVVLKPHIIIDRDSHWTITLDDVKGALLDVDHVLEQPLAGEARRLQQGLDCVEPCEC